MRALIMLIPFVLLASPANGQLFSKLQNNVNQVNQTDDPPSSSMSKAYEISNAIVKDRLHAEDDDNKRLIEDISSTDLVVIDGTYDHIHLVLFYLKLPFVRLNHQQLLTAELNPHQTVFVNCASSFPVEGARKLATFVAHGGQLITTDWALEKVLEPAFPGVVEYNKKPTADEVVRIEVIDREDPVIKGFLDEETAPVWWLESSSYPIRILDKDKVKVLIKSKELKEKYDEEAVLIKFEYGKGVVYHMISHFYLQRTETKDAAQRAAASSYFKAKNISQEQATMLQEEAADLNYGEVQSANTSAEFIMRAVIVQKKRNENNK
ncbi:MAG: hypothetical protein LBG19_00475 [Prevotellaceae bacterium]|nr:hypothetical protein [Prevotellaceae bacterium]